MRYRALCRFIAAATFFSALIRWRAFLLTSHFEHGLLGTIMNVVPSVMFALALASVAGMWCARPWGFIAFYPFGVLFTIVFGASLIPFVPLFLPEEVRTTGVFVINGVVLAAVALVHWKHP